MRIALPYGVDTLNASLDWGRCLGSLEITDVPAIHNMNSALRRAFEKPIGLHTGLAEFLQPDDTVAILISDAFRYTGVEQILPALLTFLNTAGIRDEDILFTFATGTHRPPTESEQARILGEALFARFQGQVFVHDPKDEENLLFVGHTSRGTPVKVNKRVQDCDHVIATGAVVLHYFGGYGGGRKSIIPGIAATETIAHNHALNLDPGADRLNPAVRIGTLDGNPVAEDMLEAAQLTKVDFVLNTVLNREGKIAGLFAGALDAAHRAAAQFAHRLFTTPIKQRADLVIASAGNPKNFIQSHKALFNAYQAVKPGGRIILLTPSPEGFGGETFARWLKLGNRAAIIAELRRHAEINGQTALSTIEKAPITTFITGLSAKDVAILGGRKADSLENALELVRKDFEKGGVKEPAYYLMPSASFTVPMAPE